MITVLLDNDITGHRELFIGTLKSTGWDEHGLLEFITLPEAGLARNTIDRVIWWHCQTHGYLLLTGNRNQEDADSLEQTMQEENTPDSLPIITISQPQRIIEVDYRERCIHSLVDIIIFLNQYLGTGRQYIPQ
jgi:hypothetical protein